MVQINAYVASGRFKEIVFLPILPGVGNFSID